ncbi:hypothetical protein SAMN06265337_4300 [Hymenobacter gelipurpurascens]|uniref:SpoIIAA-like n=1 Tax=Hymenobacter gelipurpurascens TaxID=89968 RepID=A0A212UHG5_9BACT|nr:hypothetical protein [Hymenobacter gelipurpurascens]SNC77699.1 hypothetical protein SAMN06265337_4300 [Hymenobacter gelipurpurascens]
MPILVSYPVLVLHLHLGSCTALETEWLGYASSTDFRLHITEALDLARQHGVTAWIANDRLLGAVRPTDLTWIGEEVLPAMVELGIVRFCRLEAEQTLNRMLIAHLYEDTTPALPFETRTFPEVQQARAWATSPLPAN